jgi:hypothetical protein
MFSFCCLENNFVYFLGRHGLYMLTNTLFLESIHHLLECIYHWVNLNKRK